MKILLLNTYPHGGAGAACTRLFKALKKSGAEVRMLTAEAFSSKIPFYWERLCFLPFEKDKTVRFQFSLANIGQNLLAHPDVQWADVVHLHWINQGFVSLEMIQKIGASGKKIVWTLHDMWPFTGGCHYSRGCTAYENSCGNCPYLRRPSENDLSNRIWRKKRAFFPKRNIEIVACSHWLSQVAQSSSLFADYSVQDIPNPIDIDVFKPISEEKRAAIQLRLGLDEKKHTLLFVAMNTQDERKGYRFLAEALDVLWQQDPNFPFQILVMGKADPAVVGKLPFPAHSLGLLSDVQKIAEAYAVSDVFVIPSLEDNLPNTVMESLTCGTPVLGFRTGGIPEMVQHLKTGFIAEQKDVSGLVEGLKYILEQKTRHTEMRTSARAWSETHFAEAVIAKRYLSIYEK